MTQTKPKLTLYWCRRDFRLIDNPALFSATKFAKETNSDFLPIFILDEAILGSKTKTDLSKVNIGYPRRLFLSKVLSYFASQFERFDILTGNPTEIFQELSQQFELQVFVNDDIEPYSLARDQQVQDIVEQNGGKFNSYVDQLSCDKNTVSGTGNFYSVFTPFKKNVWSQFVSLQPLPKVDLQCLKYLEQQLNTNLKTINCHLEQSERSPQNKEQDFCLEITNLQTKIFELINKPWDFETGGNYFNLDNYFDRPTYDQWHYQEEKVLSQFDEYLSCGKMYDYKTNRDDLGLDTVNSGQTSQMSVGLKWGLVSGRTLKQKILDFYPTESFESPYSNENNGASHYISELIWREFYKYILYQRPEVLNLEFQIKMQNIPWLKGYDAVHRFTKWIKGETGYPAVDAAMRQIAQTGWMHNRARMMVASILTKNLGVDWRWGQEYFRAVLLDLDEASNNGGWQWAGSVGADPKPIRIFNPYLQAQNYDAKNLYQNKWLPKDYDRLSPPMVDHKVARNQALNRYGMNVNGGVRDF